MSKMILLLLMCLLAATIKAQQLDREREVVSSQQIDSDKDSLLNRCFDRWGCFSVGEPFFSSLRPISLFPLHPDALDAQFLLVTRTAPELFQRLRVGNNSSFEKSNFDPLRPVKIIIHGYREKGDQDWVKELIRELLTSDDYNIITVDWRAGAAQSYPQAVANTRSLGLVVADFIDYLQRKYRISPSDIHVIGHNLGAHAAGYVGDQVPRLGRITGLDPAGPYFEDTDAKVRLDPSDALFVDVIHTDTSPTTQVPAMLQPAGHVDFYPSPGWRRRIGCDVVDGMKLLRRCKTVHAPELFTESVNIDCPFFGYKCDSYSNFSNGLCSRGCGKDMKECASMGFKAEEWQQFSSSEPVTMFLETGLNDPHCRYHYHVKLLLSGQDASRTQRNETGLLFVRLTGSKGRTALYQAVPKPVAFTRGNVVEFVISARNLGHLLRVDAFWSTIRPHRLNEGPPSIYIHSFRITNFETGYKETFCGGDKPIIPDRVRVFFKGGSC